MINLVVLDQVEQETQFKHQMWLQKFYAEWRTGAQVNK
jgi:hypothetical protein